MVLIQVASAMSSKCTGSIKRRKRWSAKIFVFDSTPMPAWWHHENYKKDGVISTAPFPFPELLTLVQEYLFQRIICILGRTPSPLELQGSYFFFCDLRRSEFHSTSSSSVALQVDDNRPCYRVEGKPCCSSVGSSPQPGRMMPIGVYPASRIQWA